MTQMVKKDPKTFAIIGPSMEVHQTIGYALLEAVYQEALALEFELRHIPFQLEISMPVIYKGRKLGTLYRADFLCYDTVLLTGSYRYKVTVNI